MVVMVLGAGIAWLTTRGERRVRQDKEIRMESVATTHIWMAGVIAVMPVYGIIAIVGLKMRRKFKP